MESLQSLITSSGVFLEAHAPLAYFVLFLGSYFETLIGVGFFVYGEVFFIPGALLAGAGVLNIWAVASVLIVGGVLGDISSYAIGWYRGAGFFKEHNKIFNHTNYQKGLDFFTAHGSKSVFLARLLGPVSWVTPFLAGVYKMPFRTFVAYNILGVTVGIGQFLVVGYFFGNNYRSALSLLRQDALMIVIIVVVSIIAFGVYKRNRE